MRFLSLELIEGPAAEPVTLAQAKQHLRQASTLDDDYIPILIQAAREWCEAYMYRKVFNQTWQRTLDYFPIWIGNTTVAPFSREDWMFFSDYWAKVMIQLPGQINSVTSITYEQPSWTGNPETWSTTTITLPTTDYVVDLTSIPARLVPQQGMTWPVQELYVPGSVKIQYVAGSWGDGVETNTCPNAVVLAMLLLIKHWYDNRSAVDPGSINNVPLGVYSLLDPLKTDSFYIS